MRYLSIPFLLLTALASAHPVDLEKRLSDLDKAAKSAQSAGDNACCVAIVRARKTRLSGVEFIISDAQRLCFVKSTQRIGDCGECAIFWCSQSFSSNS